MADRSAKQSFLKSKLALWISVAIIAICSIANCKSTFDIKPDLNGDNIYYYSLGQAISDGKGFTDIMRFEETPHVHFPPGYPAFIAMTMKFIGSDYTTMKVMNEILLCLSLILLFLAFRKITGNLIVPLVVILLCTMQKDLLYYSTIVMSEMLYLFLTSLSITIIAYIWGKELDFKNHKILQFAMVLPLLLVIAYIYFVRTMGVSFILAVICYYALLAILSFVKEKKGRRFAIMCCLVIFALVCSQTAWNIRNKSVNKKVNDYVTDFYKKEGGGTMTTTEDWLNRIEFNFDKYITYWIPQTFKPTREGFMEAAERPSTSGEWILGLMLIAVMAIGLFSIKRCRWLLFFYIGANMGVLLIWPEQYGGVRYFLSLVPIFIFLLSWGVAVILKYLFVKVFHKEPQTLYVDIATALLVLVFIAPGYSTFLKERKLIATFPHWDERIVDASLGEFISISEWCGKNLPDSTRVICRKPEMFYLFSHGHKSKSFPYHGSKEDVFKYLENEKATHIIIDRWYSHAYKTLYPLISDTVYSKYFKPVIQVSSQKDKKIPPTMLFEFKKNN